MALTQSPSIVTNGLVMYYDMANIQKSSRGAPTTNISTGMGIGTYLNTPSDVTSTLTQTGESYRGQPVYKQVLTPITATGVSYLTNAGNPGIGTVTGGGGGAAARYTGHSIFFNPAVGRLGLNLSTPIYTHYSNIGGWQSSANYDDMGDGWYRAHVIFYSAGGGSDGKYWAINPAGATLNVPLTVYWAAPFKEDRNDSTHVSAYVNDTRSNTQSILDLTGNNTVTANSLTYASNNTFSFVRASSNYINISANTNTRFQNPYQTWSGWVNIVSTGPNGYSELWNNAGNTGMTIQWTASLVQFFIYNGAYLPYPVSVTNALNTWMNITCVIDNVARVMILYKNGALVGTSPQWAPYTPPSGSVHIGGNFATGNGGDFTQGTISNVQLYNRALSAAEVQQNFNALRGRYGI